MIGTAFCYALIPWLPTAWMVFATLFVAGFLAGMLEINLNLEADRIEAQLGRRVMNRAHGMWSLGFFVTALIAAGVRQAGIPVVVHTGVAFVLVVVGERRHAARHDQCPVPARQPWRMRTARTGSLCPISGCCRCA